MIPNTHNPTFDAAQLAERIHRIGIAAAANLAVIEHEAAVMCDRPANHLETVVRSGAGFALLP